MKLFSNAPPIHDSRELSKHFSDTYFALRLSLAVLALSMPFVLYLFGKIAYNLDLQPSMSAYFWAADEGQCATFPMRTYFVGLLFAIAAGLYAYKGLTPLENLLLNLAAICAALVAIFPERISTAEAASDARLAQLFETCPAVEDWAAQAALPIHYTAAVALFVLLAGVAWFCANKSLEYLPPGQNPVRFRRAYKGIAIGMVLFPIVGLLVAFLFGASSDKIFFVEAAGVLTFAVYWLVKSYELSLSQLEQDPTEALEYARKRRMEKF